MEGKSREAEDMRKSREAEDRRKSREAEDRKYFMRLIEEMEEDIKCGIFTKGMPPPNIVKYQDLLEKLWGWDKLLPMGDYVAWSDYCNYLKEYHGRNVDAISSVSDLAKTCLNSEERLATECWRHSLFGSLPLKKSIVLSYLIHLRLDSFIHTGISSDVSGAALLCIAKEADLTCQLLRFGVDRVDEYLIDQGIEIRTCALSLLNCTSANSVAASAVLLGMAREAEMMCVWMSKNNKPVDISDYNIPDEIVDSRIVRYETLNVMIDILEESSSSAAAAAWHKIDKEPASRNAPGDDGDGITADGAANTAGGGISDELNSHYKKKIEVGEMRKKRKITKEYLLEKAPSMSCSKNYRVSYHEEYYQRNVFEFFAGAPANQNPEDLQITNNSYRRADLIKSCLKMEDELLSQWKTRVIHSIDDTLPVSIIIQCSLIKELALSICSKGGTFSPSEVAFVCITKEADLMCELLKHGTKPIDDIIQQVMAYEAEKMCDFVKREKQPVSLSFPMRMPRDIKDCYFARVNTFHTMIDILLDSSHRNKNVWTHGHMPLMTATKNARDLAMTGTKATARTKMVACAAAWLLPKLKFMLYFHVLENCCKAR